MAFVYTSAGSIGMSSTTLGQMSVRAARISGAHDAPDRVGAADAVRDSLRRLNEYLWEFLSVTGADITIVADQATYDLPTPFHKQMSVRLGANRTLTYVRQSDIDQTLWSQGGVETGFYTMWNSQSTGVITLFGTPTTAGAALSIKYYRPITIPNSNSDLLDIPDSMERFVKLDAQYQIGIEQNIETGKLDRVRADRENTLAGIQGFDRDPGPGVDQSFIPMVGHGGTHYPADHPYNYLGDDY